MPEGTSYETIEKVFPCQLSILKKIKSILIDQCLGTYVKLVKIALKKFPPKISKPPIIFERPQVEVKFKRDGLEPEKVQFATSESLNVIKGKGLRIKLNSIDLLFFRNLLAVIQKGEK